MKNEQKYISVRRSALLTGLDPQTIRKFFDNKTINGYKTPSGQRKICISSIQKMCNIDIPFEKIKEIRKTNFLYARVSTKKQLDDLSRQIEYIKQYYESEYGNDYIIIQDICSGINFKRKGLSSILDACISRTIGKVAIAHKDRLCRFAFELLESIINKAGGEIVVLNKDNNKSSEEELSNDLLSIIHVFNCRQMGKRKYKTKVKIVENTTLSNEITDTET